MRPRLYVISDMHLGGTANAVALCDFQGVKPIIVNPLAL